MTLALLELAFAGAFLYAGFKCLKLIPLLAGNEVPGDSCTGSLLAIIGAWITAKVGSNVIGKILSAAGGAAAGAAAKAAGKRFGGSTDTSPTEPIAPPPTPELPPPVEIAAMVPLNTSPAVAGAGVATATAVPMQARGLDQFTVTV